MKLSFSSPIFRRLYFAQDGMCFYCNKKMLTDESTDITRDHFVPLSKKGDKYFKNIVLSCFECNFKKADKKPTKHQRDKFKLIAYLVNNYIPSQIKQNAHQKNI